MGLGASTTRDLGFRTNVGVYNPGATDGSATVTVFRTTGTMLGTPVTVTAVARRPIQLNDIAAQTGEPTTDIALYAVVDSSVPVFSYATVIDNQSADSMIVTGAPGPTLPPPVNLLQNGNFMSNADGWSLQGNGTAQWNLDGDTNEASGAGSILVTNTDAATQTTTYATQCVAVQPGKTYTWRFSCRVPLGQPVDPSNIFPAASGDYYAGPSCAGAPVGAFNSVSIGLPPGSFYFRYASFTGLAAPANAGSALLRFGAFKRNAGGAYQVHWDTLWFSESDRQALVVPASASIHGANNSFFQTDLWSVLYGSTQASPFNIFQAAGAASATGAAYTAVVSSNVNVISYATVIDNQSTDSVIVTGVPY